MKKIFLASFVFIMFFSIFGWCDNETEFVVEDDLTINGTQGTYEDPDVELKGFVVIGATQPTYTANISTGPGNVIINGILGVSSGAYIVGNTTITYITSATFSGASSIFINDGSTGNSLRKSSAGYLEWYDPTQYGDNLGNHLATTTLDMKNFPIINISSLAITGTGVSGSDSLLSIAGSTMVVLNNGNVGIGTTPAYKLDVSGDLRVTGRTIFGGVAYTWPSSAGSSGQVLTTDGSGNLSWSTISGGGVSGSGTQNYLAKWTGTTTLGNSIIYDNGTNVGIGTTNPTAKLYIRTTDTTTVPFQVEALGIPI
jgi:hypothetical protein